MYFNSMLIRLLFKPSAYNTWHVVLFTVQSLSWLCLTLCDPMESARKASLSFTISQNLFKLMSIESVMPSNHLILCHPFLLLPSIFPSSVHSLSRVRLFATPWITARQASLSISNTRSLLKLVSIELVIPSNHLILCHPLLLLPSIFPSIRVFSNESALHIRWPKYWSFSFSFSPSKEYSGLISFRMDWLDLLAVQGTPKSLLQY